MKMNEMIIKSKIMEYAESILSPMLAETLAFCESIEDEGGTTNIWLLEMDNGEEYWILEGVYPSNLYKKCGIYETTAHVYTAYKEMLEEDEARVEALDRFQQYQ